VTPCGPIALEFVPFDGGMHRLPSGGAVSVSQPPPEKEQRLALAPSIIDVELTQASQYARSLIEASLDPLVTISPEGKITDVNEATTKVTGVAREVLIGTDFSSYFTEPDKARDGYQRVFSEGSVIDYPLTIRHRDGTFTHVLYNYNASFYRDTTGNVLGVFAAARDITELNRRERQLRVYANELAAANSELEAFSYAMSHDLRAPLRAIEGFAGILVEDHAQQLNAEARRLLDVITANTRRMATLIDGLLLLSRVSRTGLAKAEVNLDELAREVVDELRGAEPNPHIEVRIDSLGIVQADAALLRQVLVNLVSNALKFTRSREKAQVEIGRTESSSETVLFVKDNGVGFDTSYVDKLFRPFQRLHSAAEFEGAGIGLAVVERIVRKHGGRVWAQGEAGKGACFCFALSREEADGGC